MIPFLFFLFAIIAVASAIMVIVHRNPIYSALFLIITLFSIAGLFVLLNAPFIAAVHIIVYAGAIMVLFLFVIMLLDIKSDKAKERPSRLWQLLGIFMAGILFIELGFMLKSGTSLLAPTAPSTATDIQIGKTRAIGELLFTKYLFSF
ncbi:MAG: NADH-quinone oxidoreductase subunit J, partial [bacterium]